MPKIYGYARSSTDEQVEGPQIQADRIKNRADLLIENDEKGLTEMGDILLEHASAEKVPYDKRVQFKKLMNLMKPHDILIVVWLNRIDRNALRMVGACQMLSQKGIRIIELSSPFGGEMDLGTPEGRNMLLLRALLANTDSAQRSDATKAAKARDKRLGRALGGSAPYGRTIVSREETEYIWTKGRQVPVKVRRKYLVWHPGECQQIVELVARKRAGETFLAITRDWHRRKLTRASGKLWFRKLHKGSNGSISYATLWNVYYMAENEIAKTGTMGGIEMPPKPIKPPKIPKPKKPPRVKKPPIPPSPPKTSLQYGKKWWERI